MYMKPISQNSRAYRTLDPIKKKKKKINFRSYWFSVVQIIILSCFYVFSNGLSKTREGGKMYFLSIRLIV